MAVETPLLDTVKFPADLRKLDKSELRQFADELRAEMIDAVSVTGGHLGSGLGVVELTTAIHYVFNTPDDHPVPFTHAHWPTDAFDESIVEAHWAFGRKGSGCVSLWCSEPLSLKSEVLTDRELRADGRCVAWMCFCNTESDLNTFSQSCKSANPSFDKESLELVSEAMYLSFE